MSETTKELKAELEKSAALLSTLRDEVKVRLHLAGMEARARWNDLEPRVQTAIDKAKEAGDASQKVVSDAVNALKKFHASLK